jgi:tetratricopeptide (TPR) repeat protein
MSARLRAPELLVVAAALVLAAGTALFVARACRSPEAPRLFLSLDPAQYEPPLRELLAERLALVERRLEDPEAWGELARACHAHGLYDAARAAYERAEQIDSSDSLWPHLRGIACDLLGRHDEAIAAFERSIAMEPFDVVARCFLARILAERGDAGRARELYLEAVKVDPRSVAAWVGLGQLALEAGAIEMAEKNLRLALEELPSCGPAHSALALLCAREGRETDAAFHRAWSHACSGRVPLPDPYVEAIEKLGVTYEARLRRGRRAAQAGDLGEAVEDFRAAARLRPELGEPRLLLASALAEAGRSVEAERELEAAASFADSRVKARLRLARIHAARGRREEARALIEEVLADEPQNTEALVGRGDLAIEGGRGDRERALAEYDRALAIDPTCAAAHLARGRALHLRAAAREEALADPAVRERERTRAREALAAFERALELQADSASAYAGAGRVLMQLWELAGDPAEKASYIDAAIGRFRQLTTYFRGDKEGHLALIRALHSAGRVQEMLAAIARARALWPDDPQFRRIDPAEPPAGERQAEQRLQRQTGAPAAPSTTVTY